MNIAGRIATARLDLEPITVSSLQSERTTRLPDLPGVGVTGWPPEHWEPHVFDWIEKQYTEHPETFGFHRYILLRAHEGSAVLVGTLGAHPLKDGEVEFGYSVLPEYQRRGIATEAARALIAWLWDQPHTRAVSAQTFPSQKGSIRVMENCGLTPAGAGDEEGTVRYRLLRLPSPTPSRSPQAPSSSGTNGSVPAPAPPPPA